MNPLRLVLSARLAAGLLALFLAAGLVRPATAGPYLVYDAASGEVLAENQAFHPWYPASLTKLMTAYVTFRAMAAGEIGPDSPVVMTANAAKEPPSKMGFKPGTVITIDTALKIIVVKSANDVAMALGEAVGGSEAGFVARMNAEARRLGMANTRFANPNGLPNPNQWTTARDFAILSRAILREYPGYAGLFRITALSLGAKVIKTHNHLLERYPGTDGMKTGFICASGFNVVASATRGGRRLVAVVFGERNAKVRAEKTAELLETAFATRSGLFSRRTTLDKLQPSDVPPTEPTDMRPYVCGKDRDTGEDADDAGVTQAGSVPALQPKSYLVPRFKTMDPVPISIGGATSGGEPLPAELPPLPRPRPANAAAFVPAGDPAATPVDTADLRGSGG